MLHGFISLWVVILISVSAIACAPITSQSIGVGHAVATDIRVSEPYQAVFKRVANQLRQCQFYTPMGAQHTVVGEKHNHLRQANIRLIRLYGPTSQDVSMLIKVEAISDTESSVGIHATFPYRKSARAARAWASGESLDCV